MSEGQKAAEQTKDFFKTGEKATEDLRQNINSFADNLLGGNKQHASTGIHPDARKTGEKVSEGAGSAAGKLEDKSKK